jgi:hypothetical protein
MICGTMSSTVIAYWQTASFYLPTSAGADQESSAVIEYSLSDGAEIFRYDPGIFSVWLGDVERLPNGNTLVTFSIAGVIHEIDANGNLVREITASAIGYSSWRPTLYGSPFNI